MMARVKRMPKEINPVTDLTLILLGTSSSKKYCVAKQILYHLKGYIPPDDEPTGSEHTLQNGEPATGSEHTLQNGEPSKGTEQVPQCQTYEGKVLGLKTKTVIIPDGTDHVTENEEMAIEFGNHVKQLVSGEYVIVLVTETKKRKDRMLELEQPLCLIQSIFGEDIQKYSLVVITCATSDGDTETKFHSDLTRVQNCRRNAENEEVCPMTFDINASKKKNDLQVQRLLNQAKTIVKKKRKECPQFVIPHIVPDTRRNTRLPSSSSVDMNTASDDRIINECSGEDSMSNMTWDDLEEENRKLLDECCEVFDYDVIFPPGRSEEEVCLLAEHNSDPRDISFVTANPVGFGDCQC